MPSQPSRTHLSVTRLEPRDVPAAPSYLLPSVPNASVSPILTVGEGVGGYRMAGIPDGLGAYDNGDGTFTVLMNHELPATAGVVRDHGAKGAFVSKWVIRKSDLSVVSGDDLIQKVYLWNSTTSAYEQATTAFNRLCSADLPAASAFYNPATGRGTTARIFMNGEETSNGRAFAHVATGPEAGTSWNLPWTGLYAWENHVASPFPQDKTVVVGLDDSRRDFTSEGATEPSEVYVWVGKKKKTGNAIERAGLGRDGLLYGIRVGLPGAYDANEGTVASGERFEMVGLSDQTANTTFAPLQSESAAKSITQFRRVEDGQFDPNKPNDFYFVTTDQFGASGTSRLWRLRFDDITRPERGGKIELLIDGGGVGSNVAWGTGEMFDNLTVDGQGRVLLQEDVGNQAHLGKVWAYDIATGGVLEVARHNADLFLSSSPNYLGTQDEESSGIIDVSDIFGEGAYLFDVQVHRNISATDPELVELGQLGLLRMGATAGLGFDAATNRPAVVAFGSSGNDLIQVSQIGTGYTVQMGAQRIDVTAPAADAQVIVSGYDGHDLINLLGVQADTIANGGDGWDVMIGGAGRDVFTGGAGFDLYFLDDDDVVADPGFFRGLRFRK